MNNRYIIYMVLISIISVVVISGAVMAQPTNEISQAPDIDINESNNTNMNTSADNDIIRNESIRDDLRNNTDRFSMVPSFVELPSVVNNEQGDMNQSDVAEQSPNPTDSIDRGNSSNRNERATQALNRAFESFRGLFG